MLFIMVSKSTPSASQQIARTVLRFRCPHCGQGKIFERGWQIRPKCESCGTVYDKLPGNFLGALMVSHLLTAVTVVIAAVYYFKTDQLDGMEWKLILQAAIVTAITYPPVRAAWLLVTNKIQAND